MQTDGEVVDMDDSDRLYIYFFVLCNNVLKGT